MDYSLLLLIESRNEIVLVDRSTSNQRNRKLGKFENCYVSVRDRKETKYHFGIIDYLQSWDFHKRMEMYSKLIKDHKSKKTISAVPPKFYQERFFNFMKKHVVLQTQDENSNDKIIQKRLFRKISIVE